MDKAALLLHQKYVHTLRVVLEQFLLPYISSGLTKKCQPDERKNNLGGFILLLFFFNLFLDQMQQLDRAQGAVGAREHFVNPEW